MIHEIGKLVPVASLRILTHNPFVDLSSSTEASLVFVEISCIVNGILPASLESSCIVVTASQLPLASEPCSYCSVVGIVAVPPILLVVLLVLARNHQSFSPSPRSRHRRTGAGNWHCSFVAATTTTSASRHCSVPPSAVPPSAFSRRDPALFFSVLWVPSSKVVWLSFDQVLTVISQKNHSQRLTKHQSKMNENSNIEAAGMSASTQPSSPPSSVRKNRSAVWDHFDVENAIEKKAKCKYCGSLIQYGNGTSSMGGHLRRCKQNPNNDSNKRRKTMTTPTIDERGVLNSPSASKFDQEEARRALVEMFIGEELPFRFVESPKFRKFVHALQARFKVPSRTTLARDIGALYAEEKMKLQDFLSTNCGRVCLTTDTWTSIQNFTYMSLTAHFVDLDWKLHKKILKFCQVTSHSGEVIGATIESCLNNWNLNRVFSVTVDNASSNDVAIKYLKQRLNSWNSIILNGEFIHMSLENS
nr:zinc finger BED domain-containing protein RICESLEEPER 2-like [Arachis hypogaea]